MSFKIRNFFLLIFLILLQSCSGGRIGNFLETSFKNIEESKIKEDIKNNSNNKFAVQPEENLVNKDIKESKIKEDIKNNSNNKFAIQPEENLVKKNIKESKIKEDIKNNSNNKFAIQPEENLVKKDIKESKIKEDIKNNSKNKVAPKFEKKPNNKKKAIQKNVSLQKKQYKSQSYKIIFILKDVDPKDPIENLSTILRNSDVNFEIEKIERFFDSKNKDIKK